MNELHITKVNNGYIVKTIQIFGKEPREFIPSESLVFSDLIALHNWLVENFKVAPCTQQ